MPGESVDRRVVSKCVDSVALESQRPEATTRALPILWTDAQCRARQCPGTGLACPRGSVRCRTDPERAAPYSELSCSSVERHDGRFLARGGAVGILEGDWEPERLVMIEFASMDAAQAWFDSGDYRQAHAYAKFGHLADGRGQRGVTPQSATWRRFSSPIPSTCGTADMPLPLALSHNAH